MKSRGFIRTQCPKCSQNFWKHHTSKKTDCGDSECRGKYEFIGTGLSTKYKDPSVFTYHKAFETFQEALGNPNNTNKDGVQVPCKTIDRYPVVARWRNDVDFTAAGIYCFQPACVSGEVEPPENPLICSQPCLRFNDLGIF